MFSKIIKPALLFSIAGAIGWWGCNTQNANTENTPALPKTDTVVIDQMQFTPAELTIQKGDTVFFINKDLVAHDATEVNKAWHSPTLQSGDSWKIAPDKSADYYCSIHLVMKGKIVVQ